MSCAMINLVTRTTIISCYKFSTNHGRAKAAYIQEYLWKGLSPPDNNSFVAAPQGEIYYLWIPCECNCHKSKWMSILGSQTQGPQKHGTLYSVFKLVGTVLHLWKQSMKVDLLKIFVLYTKENMLVCSCAGFKAILIESPCICGNLEFV